MIVKLTIDLKIQGLNFLLELISEVRNKAGYVCSFPHSNQELKQIMQNSEHRKATKQFLNLMQHFMVGTFTSNSILFKHVWQEAVT